MKAAKKLLTALLVICLTIIAVPITTPASSTKVNSSSSTSGKGNAIKVKKVTYEKKKKGSSYVGEVDVDFSTKVTWKKDAKIKSIKDNKKKSYKGTLKDKDKDECEIQIKKPTAGRTYTIVISGIKKKGTDGYRNLTLKIKVPSQDKKLAVKEITYDDDFDDDDDDEKKYTLDIKFNQKIKHKDSSYVIIKDSKGKTYSSKTSYIDWDNDECEVHLSKRLSIGKTYSYEIKNIKAAGSSKYTTLKGNFKAAYDD